MWLSHLVSYFVLNQRDGLKRGERRLAGEARTIAAYTRESMMEEDMDRRRIAAKREQRIKFMEATQNRR